jgi:hypothetical protein
MLNCLLLIFNNMKKIYFITFAILFFTNISLTQTTFNKRMNFGYPAAILTSIVATDSCYYANGILADSVPPYLTSSIFVRFDLEGNEIYHKALIGEERTYETWMNSLTTSSSGDFTNIGQSFFLDEPMKGFLIKYNHLGDTILIKEFINPQNPLCPDATFISPRDFKSTFDKGGIITGYFVKECPNFNAEIFLIKTDSLGNVDWFNTFGDARRDLGVSLVVRENGSIIVGGVKTNTDEVTENYLWQTHIFQVDSLGNQEWSYLSPPDIQRDGAKEMVSLEDGSLIVASGIGYEQERSSRNDMWFEKSVFKLNPDHELEWEKEFKDTYFSGRTQTNNLIALSDDSGFIVTGTETYNPNVSWITQTQGWLMKFNEHGDTLWSRRYIHPMSQKTRHRIDDIKETADGGFILCGESFNSENNVEIPQQSWLLKLDDHGCLIPGCYTATEEVENGQLPFKVSIYPNPTTDYLNIYHYFSEADFWQNGQYRIVDSQGREVAAFPIGQNDVTMVVPVWEWAKGVYFLQLVVADGVVKTEKFVVQ